MSHHNQPEYFTLVSICSFDGTPTVIGIFEDAMEKGMPIPVIGDGSQSRDFTHIDDIVKGLYEIFEQEKNKED